MLEPPVTFMLAELLARLTLALAPDMLLLVVPVIVLVWPRIWFADPLAPAVPMVVLPLPVALMFVVPRTVLAVALTSMLLLPLLIVADVLST